MYLLATGGNPGLTIGTDNAASVMMAALGPCSGTLDPNEFIIVNEVTTVGAYALAQFATDAEDIGASAANSIGIANAFTTANNITDLRDGQARTQTPYYAAYAATLPAFQVNSTVSDRYGDWDRPRSYSPRLLGKHSDTSQRIDGSGNLRMPSS